MEKLMMLFPVALLLVLTTACGNTNGVSPERQEFEEGVEN